MRFRAVFLAGMPLLVIGLLLAERLSALALGFFPASADLWFLMLELRNLFRRLSDALALLSGHAMTVQLGLLAAAMGLVVLAARRRSIAPAFLVNHLALIAVTGVLMTTATSDVASAGNEGPLVGAAYAVGAIRLGWLSGALLATALAGCAYCHIAFLINAKRVHQTVSLRITELSRNF